MHRAASREQRGEAERGEEPLATRGPFVSDLLIEKERFHKEEMGSVGPEEKHWV